MRPVNLGAAGHFACHSQHLVGIDAELGLEVTDWCLMWLHIWTEAASSGIVVVSRNRSLYMYCTWVHQATTARLHLMQATIFRLHVFAIKTMGWIIKVRKVRLEQMFLGR